MFSSFYLHGFEVFSHFLRDAGHKGKLRQQQNLPRYYLEHKIIIKQQRCGVSHSPCARVCMWVCMGSLWVLWFPPISAKKYRLIYSYCINSITVFNVTLCKFHSHIKHLVKEHIIYIYIYIF